MTKSLLALAVLGSMSIHANAESSVTIYGAFDIGIVKVQSQTTAMGRGDNNKLGFKGIEDLGGGLSAIFQLETRFEPDTGTTEASPNRPFFQGESRVGLKGDFGMVRFGRGYSSLQDDGAIRSFEIWRGASNRANLSAFSLAGYNGDPLNPGSSQNRFSNAIFYNSPVVGAGFEFSGSIASKEALASGTPKANPYSLVSTFNNGPFSAMVGYERNAIDTKVWNVSGGYTISDFRLLATVAEQKNGTTGLKTTGLTLGGRYTAGAHVVLAGYGRNKPNGINKTSQFSVGYEYNLSKRTFIYTDIWQRKAPGVSNTNVIDVGIHHTF